MATEKQPMPLDEEPAVLDAQPAKDVDGVPYCRKHHCRMKCASSGKKGSPTKYYACPVDGCDQKSQMIKTNRPGIVPPQPQACPKCAKVKGETVFCERDERFSTAAMVILKCPKCGWKTNGFVVPQLAAAHFALRDRPQKSKPKDVGER